MDTTLTVRLDTQLKEEAERTLDSLGLSMAYINGDELRPLHPSYAALV